MARQLRPAVTATVAALAAWVTALGLRRWAGADPATPVLAVALAVTLSRGIRDADSHGRLHALLLLPVVGLLAGHVGYLLVRHPWIGDPLFVAGVSGGIWVRRFGPAATRMGTFATLPFVGVLIAPVPPGSGTPGWFWPAAIAVVAFGWVVVAQRVLHVRPAPGRASVSAGRALAARARRAVAARSGGRPRLPVSTRMALQMAVSLGAAFLLGHLAFGHHWAWTVLSAYVVGVAGRGRGDVAYKAILRVAGASVGTAAATVTGGVADARDPWLVVAIFVVLPVALWLRACSYGFWAAGVTAILALLYAYDGVAGPALLPERLGGVAAGALAGVLAAWFLAPVRTRDVLRVRRGAVLRVLGEAAVCGPDELPGQRERLGHALAAVEEIAPGLRFERRLARLLRRPGPYRADAVDDLRAAARPPAQPPLGRTR